ncbi:MAG: hypothetical protein EAY75_03050 [Bacteroidetes bacterium]|nr:MAG: hypothetical protein EAY75_03050 [Bacteroidota bacterium]
MLKLQCLMVALTVCATVATAQPKPTVVRAAWVTNVGSPSLTSRTEIKKTVLLAKQSGLTHLCVVTWNRGYTLYRSATMKKLFGVEVDPAYGGRDPLQEMIEEAHAQNIKVIAWFEFGFSNAYQGCKRECAKGQRIYLDERFFARGTDLFKQFGDRGGI